uniref:Uncharacterized protein n=1 Tax=Mycena chlorophos TaxID=658473 RepID=A0ABQ0LP81_MYCCL|nr:predicted protein [Mycena chlorophos]
MPGYAFPYAHATVATEILSGDEDIVPNATDLADNSLPPLPSGRPLTVFALHIVFLSLLHPYADIDIHVPRILPFFRSYSVLLAHLTDFCFTPLPTDTFSRSHLLSMVTFSVSLPISYVGRHDTMDGNGRNGLHTSQLVVETMARDGWSVCGTTPGLGNGASRGDVSAAGLTEALGTSARSPLSVSCMRRLAANRRDLTNIRQVTSAPIQKHV